MVKIKRSKCPTILSKKKKPTSKAYRSQKVVSALWEMQLEKCCYCEQRIPDEGHQKAVEHFRPKSIFKGLKNNWVNLLLACSQCNGEKSDKFPIQLIDKSNETKVIYLRHNSSESPLLIDPSDPQLDPEDHIDFLVDDREEHCGLIIAKDNSQRGTVTINTIGLHKKFYTNKRQIFLIDILLGKYLLMMQAMKSKNENTLNSLKIELENLMSAGHEFAAFARAFAKHKRLDERFGLQIPHST